MADGEELTACPLCGAACLHYWSREGTQGYRRLAPDPAATPPAAPSDPIVCHRHVGRDPHCAICTPARSIAGSIAAQALVDTLEAGGTVEIPSLGITLTKKDLTPAAPSDREAAMAAEVALLREACVENIPMNDGSVRLICRLCGWSNRGAGPDWHEPSCLLATPPGASGQDRARRARRLEGRP